MTASKWAVSEALREGVGHGGLALGDEGLQRLVDARVDRRRLVAVQHLLPHAVGALRSEEHTSELQSLMRISYAVFCLKKKKNKQSTHTCTRQQTVEHSQHR